MQQKDIITWRNLTGSMGVLKENLDLLKSNPETLPFLDWQSLDIEEVLEHWDEFREVIAKNPLLFSYLPSQLLKSLYKPPF